MLKAPQSPLSPVTTIRTTLFSGRVREERVERRPVLLRGTRDATEASVASSVAA